MKIVTACGLIATFLLAAPLSAQATEFSKEDLTSMSEAIFRTSIIVPNTSDFRDGFDILNTPFTEQQMVKYGVYLVYVFEEKYVKHVTEGAPIKIYADQEPLTFYAYVNIKAALKATEKYFGYKPSATEENFGRMYGYTTTNGYIVLGESDAGAAPEIRAVSAERDGFGLVRVTCEQDDEEDENRKYRFKAVLKDHIVDGQKAWQVLLIK